LNLINFSKSIFKLSVLQKNNEFDLIHSHNHYAANIAEIISLLLKVKTLQTVHGIMDPIGKLNHNPCDYFISVNEHITKYLCDTKKKISSKVFLIRYGIPLIHYSKKHSNSKLIIVAAGRLTKIKAFDVYIKAIALLPDMVRCKAKFYLAGKGEEESPLLSLSKELGIKLIFLNEIPLISKFFLESNILVNPSRSKNEGFPLTIVEAALAKNLIISSNFLGHDSILKDGINSLIFNVDDPQELSKKISIAIENYEELLPIADVMYEIAIKEFDLDKMVSRTISFYKEILQ
jgi:glycosyltransferase involved in cell wall biosynthesis